MQSPKCASTVRSSSKTATMIRRRSSRARRRPPHFPILLSAAAIKYCTRRSRSYSSHTYRTVPYHSLPVVARSGCHGFPSRPRASAEVPRCRLPPPPILFHPSPCFALINHVSSSLTVPLAPLRLFCLTSPSSLCPLPAVVVSTIRMGLGSKTSSKASMGGGAGGAEENERLHCVITEKDAAITALQVKGTKSQLELASACRVLVLHRLITILLVRLVCPASHNVASHAVLHASVYPCWLFDADCAICINTGVCRWSILV